MTAACTGVPPRLFDADQPRQRLAHVAAAFCGYCPIRADCEARARVEKLPGLWGGVVFGHGRPVDLLRARAEVQVGRDGRLLMPCGTRGAAARHRVRGERVDDACLSAERVYYAGKARLYRRRAAEARWAT